MADRFVYLLNRPTPDPRPRITRWLTRIVINAGMDNDTMTYNITRRISTINVPLIGGKLENSMTICIQINISDIT